MKNTKHLRLVGIIGGGALLIAAFFLFFAPFISASGLGVTLNWTGYTLTFGDGAKAGITTAWVFSLLLFIGALCAIALYVLDLAGIFHLKALDNKNARYCGTACFILLSLVTGVLLFCALPLAGANGGDIGLGAGAIFGAICTILGGCLLGSAVLLPAISK